MGFTKEGEKMVGPVGPNGAFVRRVVGGFRGDRANMVCRGEREQGGEKKGMRGVISSIK